jgi:hypothetical protein
LCVFVRRFITIRHAVAVTTERDAAIFNIIHRAAVALRRSAGASGQLLQFFDWQR